MSDNTVLPVDAFSRRLRELSDNPGAVRASSTINRADFYGRNETWILDTFRIDGAEVVFLQRVDVDGAIRMVLPEEVTAALTRQRDRAVTSVRRRSARQSVATKRAAGQAVGNPDALRKARSVARKSRKARKAKRSKGGRS
jgi:hypothetical protein